MIKRLMIILTVIVLASVNLLALTGCPKETEGFEGGFTHDTQNVVENGGMHIAIKSKKSVFDMDDITIDLYYGTQDTEIPVRSDERYEPVCVAVYYQIGGGGTEVLFADYKNSGRFQIIKEFSLEDFYSGDYAVTAELKKHLFANIYYYTFTHSEKFTLPKEYFDGRRVSFHLYISIVFFDKEEGAYFFSDYGDSYMNETYESIIVGYRLLEDGKIKIL